MMCGFRQGKNFCSYLALFAIVFQLFVSFGHVHLKVFTSTKIDSVDQSGASQRQNEPARNVPNDEHDKCAICAIISLAGSLVVPDPPVIALPQVQYLTWLPDCRSEPVFSAAPSPFKSRAPPAHESV